MGSFSSRKLLLAVVLASFSAGSAVSAWAQSGIDGEISISDPEPGFDMASSEGLFEPVVKLAQESSERPPQKINWKGLVKESLFFLSIENAFRCLTEEGTRDAFHDPFFPGYFASVGNLHGWNDGDPFYVNYVGHPMQGAVTGFVWTHNDLAYRDIEFGRNKRYWKGKLRGAAYSYLYSVLFEIGPVSEASIGHIQADYPQQGFVDHVVTPVIGLGWSIAEDVLDRYLARYVESRTENPYYRLLVRSGSNPARAMANFLAFRTPWDRDNRPGIHSPLLEDKDFMKALSARNTARIEVSPPPGVAPFEFTIAPQFRTYFGEDHHGSCAGGGGTTAFRMASEWQMVVDVNGCKLLGLKENFTGDSLSYLTGPRWTPPTSGRVSPFAEVLIGGTKLTQEQVYPEVEKTLDSIALETGGPEPPRSAYSQHWETNGLTIQAGGGMDVKLNHALSIRVASLMYSRSWNNDLNRINYEGGLQLTSGLVLKMGTW